MFFISYAGMKKRVGCLSMSDLHNQDPRLDGPMLLLGFWRIGRMEHAHFSQTRCAQDKFRDSRSRVWQLHLAVVSGGAAVGEKRECVSARTTMRPCMSSEHLLPQSICSQSVPRQNHICSK